MPDSTTLGLIKPEIVDAASHIAKIFCEAGSGAIATMIGGDVQYDAGATSYATPAEIFTPADGACLVTRMAWTGDRTGEVALVMPEMAARTLVAHMMALMTGAPANPEETPMDADGLDAYVESIGNFVGQGAQALRGDLGGAIKIAPTGTRTHDFSAGAPAEVLGAGEWLCHRATLAFAGGQPFPLFFLMSVSVTGFALEKPEDPEANLASKAETMGLAPENLAHAMKIKVPLIVVLARNRMRMEIIQEMVPGTILEFKKQAGEILDVCAGHVKIAEAEVVTTNQHFGVQIRHLVDPRAARKT